MMPVKANKIAGLDIDDNAVIATELVRRPKGTFHLGKYLNAKTLKELALNPFFKDAGVVINLPTQVVLLRSFNAPAFGKRSSEILPFLSKQPLPFKLEDCFWDTFIMDSTVNLIAARKEVVERYLAQAKETGLNVIGVVNSQTALYNVFMLNYPEAQKFILLDIRTSSTDLIIHENRKFWSYPLSIGRVDLEEDSSAQERFSSELQRLVNSHYLQNPSAAKPGENTIYICGKFLSANLINPLKEVLGDFNILVLDPFKNIDTLESGFTDSPESIALSMGLSLGYLSSPGALRINLIREKIQKDEREQKIKFVKRAYLAACAAACAFLLVLNIRLVMSLFKEIAVSSDIKSQLSRMLPEVKALSEEKTTLLKESQFLSGRLVEQGLYLKALAAVSQARPAAMKIKEFNVEAKEGKLFVLFSGSSLSFEEMNEFVSRLKKEEGLAEVKVVASTLPGEEGKGDRIDFNLRFEIPLKG